jgi:hypothetical protein
MSLGGVLMGQLRVLVRFFVVALLMMFGGCVMCLGSVLVVFGGLAMRFV